MNSLSTNFLGIKMKSPLLTASGTFGYGNELTDLIDITKIGAIVTKTITLEERLGNPQPRIAEVASGMLNTIGLQNIGVKKIHRNEVGCNIKIKSSYNRKCCGSMCK